MTHTILIVEDDIHIQDIIAFNLECNGFKVLKEEDGLQGLNAAINENPDLVLLDIMLPTMDGYEILSALREKSDVPVIMLTARESEEDKLLGLDAGADDYITKPFSIKELMARINANLRRSVKVNQAQILTDIPQSNNYLQVADITVDEENYQLRKETIPIKLSKREVELVIYLMKNKGKAISQVELLKSIWGYDESFLGSARTVDVAVRRIREKLEDDPGSPRYIITRRGVGYYFNYEPV